MNYLSLRWARKSQNLLILEILNQHEIHYFEMRTSIHEARHTHMLFAFFLHLFSRLWVLQVGLC